MLRSGNPALTASTFRAEGVALEERMTLDGAVNKTGVALLVLVAAAAVTWNQAGTPLAGVLTLGGLVAGLVLALVTVFKKTWAPVTTPLYAACEGLFLGGLSASYEARFPGIVMNAVGLTFGTLAALLAAYASRDPARTSSSAWSRPPAPSAWSTSSAWGSASSACGCPTSTTRAPSGSPSASSWW